MPILDGSITSPFHFVDYKIEKLHLDVKPYLDLLTTQISGPWAVEMGIRNPVFFQSRNQYFGGVNCKMTFEREITGKPEKESVVTIEGAIVGLFSVEKKVEIEKHEKNLVFNQIPAILLPYLRAALTSTLANAGFGGVILPLINIYAAAERSMASAEIKIVP